MSWEFAFSLLGLILLIHRLKPWRNDFKDFAASTETLSVSVIIPCRNEERNIGPLLESLLKLEGPAPEILVVDDGSTDSTSTVAQAFHGVKVIKAPPKPEGWMGKSWACWFGAQQARGELLLFTDADTLHAPDSLMKSKAFLQAQSLDLLSAPPFHLALQGFEKLLGLFHLLPLIATAYRDRPSPLRVFAIGQYLLTQRKAYFASGGHESIRSSLVDDIDLAKLYLHQKKPYAAYPKAGLYQVQMYSDLKTFMLGWKRLFRLGMKRSVPLSFIELILIFHLFTQLNLALLGGLVILAATQKQHGNFSLLGVLLAPLSVVLFIGLSLWALYESLTKKEVVWHGRAYQDV